MATKQMQLCWDCKKACGGCDWSNHWKHTPIPGWTATPTRDANGIPSYCITECPEFERDAYAYGASRTPPPTPEERKAARMRKAIESKYRRIGGGMNVQVRL